MSVNRYRQHLVILPEDMANEEIANGFIQAPNINFRKIHVERHARGWTDVIEVFKNDVVRSMRKYDKRCTVLLIDFDQKEDRFEHVRTSIPEDLKERVFILGVWNNPEILRAACNRSNEEVGYLLAQGCPEYTHDLWKHELLEHNRLELERILQVVRNFLFEAT